MRFNKAADVFTVSLNVNIPAKKYRLQNLRGEFCGPYHGMTGSTTGLGWALSPSHAAGLNSAPVCTSISLIWIPPWISLCACTRNIKLL